MPYDPKAIANLAFQDGDFTQCQECSLPVLSAPFPSVNIDYVLTHEFMQFSLSYSPLALNTAHNQAGTGTNDFDTSYADFLLCSEGPRQDMGGGMVR